MLEPIQAIVGLKGGVHPEQVASLSQSHTLKGDLSPKDPDGQISNSMCAMNVPQVQISLRTRSSAPASS